MQETSALCRLLVMRTRLEIAEGRIDSAIHWLQTGLALGRHVGQHASTLIQSLISAAITTQMAVPLEDLIQAPGAPNLYWAVANLPRPFLDIGSALDGEKYFAGEGVSPAQESGAAPWSIDKARAFSDDFQTKMAMLTGDGPELRAVITPGNEGSGRAPVIHCDCRPGLSRGQASAHHPGSAGRPGRVHAVNPGGRTLFLQTLRAGP